MKKDLTGKRFGRLVVVENLGKNKHGHTVWGCVCNCGKTIKAEAGNLGMGCVSSF